jgi:hypothetical protein
MKNSILITAGVILSVLLLAGCTGGGNSNSATNPFVGGTTGLVVSFIENAPPAMVTDTNFPFTIAVRLENAGEYDIPAGAAKVTISGMNPADFGVSGTEIAGSNAALLTGSSRDFAGNVIQGTEDQVTLPASGEFKFARTLTGSLQIPLSASVCYPYQTRASGTYCIRKDVVSNVPGVCEVSGSQTLYSSGAPVQVVSMSESSAGNQAAMLTFAISHRANGYVFRTGATPACNEASIADQNKVRATIKVPGATLTCYGLTGTATTGSGEASGEIILGSNGQTTISCRLTNLPAVDAVGEVSIVLDYNYLEKKSAGTLQVRHVQ